LVTTLDGIGCATDPIIIPINDAHQQQHILSSMDISMEVSNCNDPSGFWITNWSAIVKPPCSKTFSAWDNLIGQLLATYQISLTVGIGITITFTHFQGEL
jgi:hypothetical protein